MNKYLKLSVGVLLLLLQGTAAAQFTSYFDAYDENGNVECTLEISLYIDMSAQPANGFKLAYYIVGNAGQVCYPPTLRT